MDAFKRYLYGLQWLFIGIVSAIDVYISTKLDDALYAIELNPMGRWLIRQGGQDIALFMGLKVAGTVVVLGLLVLLYHYKPKWAYRIILGVTFFQASLLIILNS
jgi:hypothetical protein